jgi:enoyl-CoA hydratase/carnithine racemase
VGLPKAKELYLAGRIWSAKEAYQNGLLTGVENTFKELQATANSFCDTVLTRSPMALTLCKEVIHAGYDMDLNNGCQFERHVFSLCFTTEDQKEGMAAFAEKRKPKFKDLK